MFSSGNGYYEAILRGDSKSDVPKEVFPVTAMPIAATAVATDLWAYDGLWSTGGGNVGTPLQPSGAVVMSIVALWIWTKLLLPIHSEWESREVGMEVAFTGAGF